MDRNINSPDTNSSIIITPSGTKRARFPYYGGFIIGSNSDDTQNVKLHLGPGGVLQIVKGNDTTSEGLNSPNKATIGIESISVDNLLSSSLVIGTDPILNNNVKLRRCAAGELEICTANDLVVEGSLSPSYRTDIKAKTLTLGTNSGDLSENIKIHRSGNGEVEFISETSVVADGTPFSSDRINICGRSFIIGTDNSVSNNVKLHRSSAGELELLSADRNTADGESDPNYRQNFSLKELTVGSNSDKANNTKLHRGGNGQLEIVSEDDTTSDGNKSDKKVQLNVKTAFFGTHASDSNNVIIRRSGNSEIEFVPGDDTTLEGSNSLTKANISAKTAVIGQNTVLTNNLRIKKGADGELEIVKADDITAEGNRSVNKAQINVNKELIGNSSTLANNPLLRRGGDAILEVTSADDTTPDGSQSTNKATLAVKNTIIGNNATAINNVKLHKGNNGELDIVTADDTTVDGTPAIINKTRLNLKSVVVGTSATDSNNIKLRKGNDKELELVEGDDTTIEDTRSTKKIQLNVKSALIGTDTTLTNNAKFCRSGNSFIQVVKGDDTTSEGTRSDNLAELGFKLETYTTINLPATSSLNKGSAVFDSDKQRALVSSEKVSGVINWEEIGDNLDRELKENIGFSVVVASNIMAVTLKTRNGQNPTASDPIKVSFRDNTASSSIWKIRKTAATQYLNIVEGATLGTVNSVLSRIYVYLIDNLGSLELAVSQKYYDGTHVINTVAMTISSDSLNVIYSSSARTGVPITCIGHIETIQAVAGEWVTNPSEIFIGDRGPKNDKNMVISAQGHGVGDVGISSAVTQSTVFADGVEVLSGLTIKLITSGKPVNLSLQPGLSSQKGYIQLTQASSASAMTAYINLLRDGTIISQFEFKLDAPCTTPQIRVLKVSPGEVKFLDNVTAGTHDYTLTAQVVEADTTLLINNLVLTGFEI